MRSWWPLILLAVAALIGYFLGISQPDPRPEYLVRVDTLVQERVRLDTVYRRDTVRLWRAITQYDTARVTDTVMRGDTVYVSRDVADEAVNACKATVQTCEQEKKVLTELFRIADSTVKATPPPVDVKKVALISSIVSIVLTIFAMK
jgi:hypothetical protein